MEFIIQFIREVLMVLPGAFLRWNWLGRKKDFFKFVEEDKSIYNYILSIAIILIISVIIAVLKNTAK